LTSPVKRPCSQSRRTSRDLRATARHSLLSAGSSRAMAASRILPQAWLSLPSAARRARAAVSRPLWNRMSYSQGTDERTCQENTRLWNPPKIWINHDMLKYHIIWREHSESERI
jgi:hypothetical protein